MLTLFVYACKHSVQTPVTPSGNGGDTTGTGGGGSGSGGGSGGCSGSGSGSQLVCFESQVLPIFLTKCATNGCHDGATAEKDLVLNSYNGIRFGRSDAIVPFDLSESKIYRRITETDINKRMPYMLP